MSSRTAEGKSPEGDVARRKRSVALWRRRSRDIQLYRKALPALIGLVIAVLAGWVLYNTVAWRFAPADKDGSMSIRMVNPKFYGRDSSNAPYVISAHSAMRDDRDLRRVVMVRPVFIQNAGTPIETTLKAQAGVYREDTRILRLDKDIVVVDKRGYTFKVDKAVVDTKNGSIKGESAIEGVGPLGRITASSYAVTPGGQQVFFRGAVRARIDQAPRR